MIDERECQLAARVDARLDELEVRIQRLVEDKMAMNCKNNANEFTLTMRNQVESVQSRIEEDIRI
jgi:hypothetical protein